MKQSPVDRARGVLRLAQEHCRAFEELTSLAGVSVETLKRWATQGKGGFWLDALLDSERGWLSSAQAVSRFLVAVAEREKEVGGKGTG